MCYTVFLYNSARTQPIIVNATEAMLLEHILPVAQKLQENARMMEREEERFNAEKRERRHLHAAQDEDEEEANTIQEVDTVTGH